MKAQISTGTKSQIAQSMIQMNGEVHEVIVFIEEPSDPTPEPGPDIFAEMDPFTVKAGEADYSRESLYTPLGDESFGL